MTKGANKAPRSLSFCYFISSFTISVTPSINTPKFSNDFVILIIPFISSFEINEGNPFSAVTAPFRLNFLSNVFIAFLVKLITNPGKLSLAKGIAISVTAFCPKWSNQEPKDPLD